MRVMVVDDEAPAREGLRIRLRGEAGVTLIAECGDVRRALEVIQHDRPDVVLLDIEMPSADGFTLPETLGDRCPYIIVVTAHERHAVRAFNVRAMDYLLKPVERGRLREALGRARSRLELERKGELADKMRRVVAEQPPVAARSSPRGDGPDRIPVRHDGVIRFVEVQDVDWIEAAGDRVILHVGRVAHAARISMSELLTRLPADRFLRIHRSTIVNAAHVRELQPWFHGEYLVMLRDGTKLKLSRTYRSALAALTR